MKAELGHSEVEEKQIVSRTTRIMCRNQWGLALTVNRKVLVLLKISYFQLTMSAAFHGSPHHAATPLVG